MIVIRQAQIEELNTIRDLALEIWPSAYGDILSKEQLEYMLQKIYSIPSLTHQYEVLKHQFILIIENNHPIGFASYSPHEDASIYHLNKIYVLPGQQGKNVGKKMLEYITDDIKNEGAQSLQLNVNRFNKAVHFYEKQGFAIIREEDIDIGNGYFMNDYVMELKW